MLGFCAVMGGVIREIWIFFKFLVCINVIRCDTIDIYRSYIGFHISIVMIELALYLILNDLSLLFVLQYYDWS